MGMLNFAGGSVQNRPDWTPYIFPVTDGENAIKWNGRRGWTLGLSFSENHLMPFKHHQGNVIVKRVAAAELF